MSRLHDLRTAWRVLRAEGLRAVADRAADRLAESRRARSFTPAPPGWRPAVPVPVLRLLATPPAPRLGGVQAQLLARLTAEARLGPVALLYPAGSAWRLEVEAGGERRAVTFPAGTPSSAGLEIAFEDGAFEAAVRGAAALTGARALHAEGLAGLPFTSLRRLRGPDLRLIVSLHDFAAFCPRPHLLEHPCLRFCDYSRDLDRCGRCLGQSWPLLPDRPAFQAARREVAAALLAEADAVVFASDFLLRAHRDLFPDLAVERSWVIAPAAGGRRGAVPEGPPRPPGPLRHVAYAGSVQSHKGAEVFVEVVERLAGEAGEALRWSVYGGGDADLLARLRKLPGVRVRGYHRIGSLSGRLVRDRVDLALVLSIWPEAYNLVLSECRLARVPVLAFDHGAVADRIRAEGGGLLVPPEAGAEGIAGALRTMLRAGKAPEVPADAAARIPDAEAAARAVRELYGSLV
ncbi:MAG TPA: glycosyltransferase [Thermoanaerobaculia bacterium]|nr:glycosyltransferase [Thermoanaerobaculia bacterium]